MDELENKLAKLKEVIKEMGSLLVAHSGGVDSTFLLKIAKDTLGDKVIGVTINSMTYPEREYRAAKEIAEAEGISNIADGTNSDDAKDFRPEIKALQELGIKIL